MNNSTGRHEHQLIDTSIAYLMCQHFVVRNFLLKNMPEFRSLYLSGSGHSARIICEPRRFEIIISFDPPAITEKKDEAREINDCLNVLRK